MRISDSRKGITVLELLLAIGVSAIIFVAIYGVFISALQVWEAETPKSLVQEEAGFAMNRIERELKKAGNITVALDTAIEFGAFQVRSPEVDNWTVSLWHFNDGAGTTVSDETGNNDGILGKGKGVGQRPVWTASGEDGYALDFDGNNDFVDCGNGSTLNLASKLFIEAWIQPDAGSKDAAVIYKTEAYRLYVNSSNKLVGSVYYSGAWHDAVSSASIARDGSKWTHAALSYDKDEGGVDELKVYINGAISGTADHSAFVNVSSNNLYIGGDQDKGQYSFGGVIDEVRISNDILKTRISFTGTELLLASNDKSWRLADEYVTTLEIDYYDTGYNRLAPPIGTDTQLERSSIRLVKVLLGLRGDGVEFNLENAVALRGKWEEIFE